MTKHIFSIACLLLLNISLRSQTLAGTDELGRTLLHNSAVGDPKPNKQVGMFYFLWLGDGTAEYKWDLNEIITNNPEVLEDYDNDNWGKPVYYPGGPVGMYFWGKPIYGYYRSDDYWVALRSVQLLTDAMVDFLVMDATNALVYPKQAHVLMTAMDDVRKQGKTPPQIVFYTNTHSGKTMQLAYDNFYKKGAPYSHPKCWYYLEGKPLIIGVSKEAKGSEYESFFTYRESQWPTVAQEVNGWPWISFTRPQKVHYNHKGQPEIINVSVAQHPNPTAGMGGSAFYGNTDNWGRSYRNGSAGNPAKDILYGYNFQEQWDYALTQNVPFVYVTGWNEWVAGRWDSKDGNPQHSWFCDQASPEYSRDIEPTITAGLKDNYYMQLINNVRRYKGVAPNTAGTALTINQINDWAKVTPSYVDYVDDTKPRNHAGAQSKPSVTYTNNTGRNDFHILKTAHDKQNLYFYAETADNFECDDKTQLYIDTDRNFETGWYGYNYRVIAGETLQKYTSGKWQNAGKVNHNLQGNKIMLTIPYESLEIKGNLNIEYKWCDNMQNDDPMDWYVNGDCAPGARFNCIYSSK